VPHTTRTSVPSSSATMAALVFASRDSTDISLSVMTDVKHDDTSGVCTLTRTCDRRPSQPTPVTPHTQHDRSSHASSITRSLCARCPTRQLWAASSRRDTTRTHAVRSHDRTHTDCNTRHTWPCLMRYSDPLVSPSSNSIVFLLNVITFAPARVHASARPDKRDRTHLPDSNNFQSRSLRSFLR
jgi:hypothetical protein